jgi:hypothetical protein
MTTTEDILREALDDRSARVRTGSDSWGRLEARLAAADHAPRRRPRVVVAVAAAVALLLTVGVVLVTRTGGRHHATPAAGMPDRVVVASTGELLVVDALDGSVVRTLGTFPGLGEVATGGAGKVLVTRQVATGACAGDTGPEIDRVDVATGATEVVFGGALAPAQGPRFLAYGIGCDGRALGLTDGSGANFRSDPLGSTTTETSPSIETVEPLGWSPDGTRLLYRLGLVGEPVPRLYVGALWPAVPQSETAVIPLPWGSGISAAAFLDDTHVALAESAGGRTEVRRWSAVAPDGAEHDAPVLFTVPGRVTALSADATGRHVLARTDGGVLYRWSDGEQEPTVVAHGIDAATWAVG